MPSPRSRPLVGKVRRHRLNRGGNRKANHALWRIIITRMSAHPATRAYTDRCAKEGLTKKEIISCLKRYVTREVYCRARFSEPIWNRRQRAAEAKREPTA